MKTCVFIGLCFLFFLSGCVSTERNQKDLGGSPILEPQALSKFSDVPVPVGFKVLPSASWSFESAGVRAGTLRFEGKADIEQVRSFFKEQMAMYNWNLLNIISYGDTLMNFDKDQETCIISLSLRGSVTVISVSLGPKSQSAKKSERMLK